MVEEDSEREGVLELVGLNVGVWVELPVIERLAVGELVREMEPVGE